MIRDISDQQLSFQDFIHPFGGQLNAENRWVKLAEVIPWSKLMIRYNARMNQGQGRPAKSARLMLGALIIKHKLNLSDEETVLSIQESHYLQYFCGFGEYVDKQPFAPSLFVELRKRMGSDLFAELEQDIVDHALELQKAKRKPQSRDDDDDSHGGSSNKPTHHGKLLMDATVADQMIRFPTDLSLLNQAREISETLIDALHEKVGGQKPRTYRNNARKDFLAVSKRKRAGRNLIRKGVRQQLQYLRRNLHHISQQLDTLMPALHSPFPLSHRLQRQYWIIQHLYVQQKQMFDSKTKRCDDRIVSISQPHVRPMVRGKAGKHVEFGSKLSVSMVGKLAFVDQLHWDACNESQDLIAQVESYHQRFGFYPEVVLADAIYGTRNNRKWLKDKGIRFGGKALGRPRKASKGNTEELIKIKQQRKADERGRIPIEGKFGQGKNGYRLNQIRARLASTAQAWVRSIFLVMNLIALVRFFAAFYLLGLIQAWIDAFAHSSAHHLYLIQPNNVKSWVTE